MARRYQHMDGVWRTNLGVLEIGEHDLDLMRAQYDRLIRMLDDGWRVSSNVSMKPADLPRRSSSSHRTTARTSGRTACSATPSPSTSA